MKSEIVLERIVEDGVVAGMRGAFPPKIALQVTGALFDEGIRCFELTLNSKQPIEAMQAVKKELGNAACVGMGTVLNIDDAKKVIDAGADFIVSPAFQPKVVQYVLDAGVFIAPGVATPSEAVEAWQMGVLLLKLFPIGALGIDYFKAMFGPLNHMKFMCNGAMNDVNARDFIASGAVACGMAGWLTGNGTWSDERLQASARKLVAAIKAGREGTIPVRVT